MPHHVIEIDSDSDSDVPPPNTRTGTANAADGSDIVWDTLDDGWVDRIIKEGRDL